MDELIGGLIGIAFVIALIVAIIIAILKFFQFIFLVASAAIGHPMLLLISLILLVVIGQAMRLSENASPTSTIFNAQMSVRRWTILSTAVFLFPVFIYGILVL